MIENYSTVTECVRYDVLCQNSLDKNNDYILDLSFTLSIRTSKLTKTSHYNSYQQQLYKLVKFLKERKKLGYRRISHILYDRGYRTVRTNKPILNTGNNPIAIRPKLTMSMPNDSIALPIS